MKHLLPLLAFLSTSAYASAIDLSEMSDEMVVNLAHAEMLGICKGQFVSGTPDAYLTMNGAYYYKDGSPEMSVHDAAEVLKALVKSGACKI